MSAEHLLRLLEPVTASLSGTVSGQSSGVVTTTCTQVSGPGTVTFADPSALVTTATFPVGGTYVLHLTAVDGTLSASDDVTFNINSSK